MDLNSAKMFVSVVQKGSFSGAALSLNIPIATLSRRISALEKQLGLRLLERSTRRLRLTEAGTTLFEFASRAVEEMDSGVLALQDRETELKGKLRISTPPHFEPWWRLLQAFQQCFPNIQIEVYSSERKIDLIEDGIDVAVRIGGIESTSIVARKIHSYRHKLVASQAFITCYGAPNTPEDLLNYPCAVWGKQGSVLQWHFEQQVIAVTAKIMANDYPMMRALATSGCYITELPEFLLRDTEPKNALVEILPEHPLQQQDINLLYPSRKQLSRIARAYIDFCVQNGAQYLQGSD